MSDAREQARHQIAVMQAWVDGKKIQISEKDLEVWETISDPAFNWDNYDYRVKPEERKPREIWVIGEDIYPCPQIVTRTGEPYPNQIHFIQVLPSENTGGEA